IKKKNHKLRFASHSEAIERRGTERSRSYTALVVQLVEGCGDVPRLEQDRMCVGEVLTEDGDVETAKAHPGAQPEVLHHRQARNRCVAQTVGRILDREVSGLRSRVLIVDAQVRLQRVPDRKGMLRGRHERPWRSRQAVALTNDRQKGRPGRGTVD